MAHPPPPPRSVSGGLVAAAVDPPSSIPLRLLRCTASYYVALHGIVLQYGVVECSVL